MESHTSDAGDAGVGDAGSGAARVGDAGSGAGTPGAPGAGVLPVDLRDYADVRPGEATCTRVFATARLAVDLWCIAPRQTTGVLHHPDRDTAYTVIGGRSWVVTDEGEVGLDPMGAILVPADVVHGVENRAADALIILAASSPPGERPADPAVADDGSAVHVADQRTGLFGRLAAAFGGAGRQR